MPRGGACARLRYARSRPISLLRPGFLASRSALRCGSRSPATNLLTGSRANCSIDIAATILITVQEGSVQTTTAQQIASPTQTALHSSYSVCFVLASRPPLRRANDGHMRKACHAQSPARKRGSAVPDALHDECITLSNGGAQPAACRCSTKSLAMVC
jgi:hypothetical protein